MTDVKLDNFLLYLITFIVLSHDVIMHFISESIHFIKVFMLASNHAIKLILVPAILVDR